MHAAGSGSTRTLWRYGCHQCQREYPQGLARGAVRPPFPAVVPGRPSGSPLSCATCPDRAPSCAGALRRGGHAARGAPPASWARRVRRWEAVGGSGGHSQRHRGKNAVCIAYPLLYLNKFQQISAGCVKKHLVEKLTLNGLCLDQYMSSSFEEGVYVRHGETARHAV